MLKKGDRVYHRSINGNGLIVKIDDTKQKDKYGVVFNWLRHKTVDFHDLDGAYPRQQCRWCSEDQLIPSQMPSGFTSGKVSMVGNRSLERLIRRITRIRRTRDVYDETMIVINYGAGIRYTPEDAIVLNEDVIYDKYTQCRMMTDAGVPIPETREEEGDIPDDGSWVLKPHISMGGKDIEVYEGQHPMGRYFQKRVNKLREFRVHVALWYDDPAYLVQEKRVYDTTKLCWNKKQGASFHYLHEPHLGSPMGESNLLEKLQSIAILAVKALKLDFGGVDLALCDDGKIWVFEVNTRCGLRERTFSIFKQVVWALHDMTVDQWQNYIGMRFQPKLSELEYTVTPEEREDMLEAGQAVAINFEVMNKRLSEMRADSEVQYA